MGVEDGVGQTQMQRSRRGLKHTFFTIVWSCHRAGSLCFGNGLDDGGSRGSGGIKLICRARALPGGLPIRQLLGLFGPTRLRRLLLGRPGAVLAVRRRHKRCRGRDLLVRGALGVVEG